MSSIKLERPVTLLLVAGLLVLQTSPAFAQFTSGTEAGKSWFIQMVTPLIGICVLVFFLACCMGRANWLAFGITIIGIVGFYGYNSFITMVRGWFAV